MEVEPLELQPGGGEYLPEHRESGVLVISLQLHPELTVLQRSSELCFDMNLRIHPDHHLDLCLRPTRGLD